MYIKRINDNISLPEEKCLNLWCFNDMVIGYSIIRSSGGYLADVINIHFSYFHEIAPWLLIKPIIFSQLFMSSHPKFYGFICSS